MIQPLLSAEQFLEGRPDLPEAGQWSELIRGTPVHFDPPGVDHGTVILNLSKQLAAYVQKQDHGYPCFELGLLVERGPDTVLFPSVSYFLAGARFSESDNAVGTSVPVFVVEVLSTSDRERGFEQRAAWSLQRGVHLVWGVSTRARTIEVRRPDTPPRSADTTQTLSAAPILEGFSVKVASLFAEPDWYARRPGSQAAQ